MCSEDDNEDVSRSLQNFHIRMSKLRRKRSSLEFDKDGTFGASFAGVQRTHLEETSSSFSRTPFKSRLADLAKSIVERDIDDLAAGFQKFSLNTPSVDRKVRTPSTNVVFPLTVQDSNKLECRTNPIIVTNSETSFSDGGITRISKENVVDGCTSETKFRTFTSPKRLSQLASLNKENVSCNEKYVVRRPKSQTKAKRVKSKLYNEVANAQKTVSRIASRRRVQQVAAKFENLFQPKNTSSNPTLLTWERRPSRSDLTLVKIPEEVDKGIPSRTDFKQLRDAWEHGFIVADKKPGRDYEETDSDAGAITESLTEHVDSSISSEEFISVIENPSEDEASDEIRQSFSREQTALKTDAHTDQEGNDECVAGRLDENVASKSPSWAEVTTLIMNVRSNREHSYENRSPEKSIKSPYDNAYQKLYDENLCSQNTFIDRILSKDTSTPTRAHQADHDVTDARNFNSGDDLSSEMSKISVISQHFTKRSLGSEAESRMGRLEEETCEELTALKKKNSYLHRSVSHPDFRNAQDDSFSPATKPKSENDLNNETGLLPASTNQEIEEIKLKVARTEFVIDQAASALRVCAMHSLSYPEQLESARTMLEACVRKQAFLEEIARLRTFDCFSTTLPKATISLTGISLPLKRDYLNTLMTGSEKKIFYFVCFVNYRTQVIQTPLISSPEVLLRCPFDDDPVVEYANHIMFENVDPDFCIKIYVYCLERTHKGTLHSFLKEHTKSKPKYNSLKRLIPTIKSKFTPSANRAFANRLMNFVQADVIHIRKCDLQRSSFNLKLSSSSLPLSGSLLTSIDFHVADDTSHNGFLTYHDVVGGYSAWQRALCVLNKQKLSFWRNPEDAEFDSSHPPSLVYHLSECIDDRVKILSRDVCARPYTFELKICREPINLPKQLWLSADSSEEMKIWVEKINEAIVLIRSWPMLFDQTF